MEKIAKKLIKDISEQVSQCTDLKISKIYYSKEHKEWRAYICQHNPHWEDITWRIKEPTSTGDTEAHLGLYTAKPNNQLDNTISKIEELGSNTVTSVIKNEHGIRLVWNINLINETSINSLHSVLTSILSSFLSLALDVVCQNNSEDQGYEEINEVINNDEKIDELANFPSSIPIKDLFQINTFYESNDERLPSFLKEILDKYGFDYGGWMDCEDFYNIFDEVDNLSGHFPVLNEDVCEEINQLKNGDLTEAEKWYETLAILSTTLNNSGGKILATLSPTGGSDQSFLLFSESTLVIPMVLLYHFNRTDIVCGGAKDYFDEFFEDYNKDYETFLNENNRLPNTSINHLAFEVNGNHGYGNERVLGIDEKVHEAALAGLQMAKEFL